MAAEWSIAAARKGVVHPRHLQKAHAGGGVHVQCYRPLAQHPHSADGPLLARGLSMQTPDGTDMRPGRTHTGAGVLLRRSSGGLETLIARGPLVCFLDGKTRTAAGSRMRSTAGTRTATAIGKAPSHGHAAPGSHW